MGSFGVKKLLLFVAVSAFIFQGYRIARDSGVLIEVSPLAYGQCRKMPGPAGSEDITIDRVNGIAFISAGNGREAWEDYRNGGDGSSAANGGIWMLDLGDKDSAPLKLDVDVKGKFHPHGIDLLHLDSGGRELYVINHTSMVDHEILVFSISEDHQLKLKRRIRYPELISPNDIRAVASERFLVTNDHATPRNSWMHRWEDFLGLSRTTVTYYDGENGAFVIDGLKSANGITLSEDGQMLYISEATARRVTRFSKGESFKSWKKTDSIFVDSAVDNLEWDGEGRLLTGAHPKLFDLLDHLSDATALSPSQVIRIDVEGSKMKFETLYLNSGKELSGSSVAAMMNDELLIGSVAEHHFLRCK